MPEHTNLKDKQGFDYVIGDSVQIARTFINAPPGETIEMAWFTIKLDLNDADAAAVLQKTITTVDVPGTGFITNGANGTGTLRFDIGPNDWGLMAAKITYFYDIQVRSSADAILTRELGKAKFDSEVTLAV